MPKKQGTALILPPHPWLLLLLLFFPLGHPVWSQLSVPPALLPLSCRLFLFCGHNNPPTLLYLQVFCLQTNSVP